MMRAAPWNNSRLGQVWGLTLAVMLGITAALRAAVPAALDQAPANAQAVVVIPNMKALSDKIAKLQLQLQIPSPEMADVLGLIKAQAGIVNGLKDDGALMIVLSDLEKVIDGEVDEPPVAIAVEVTDYAAFVGNYQGNAGDAVAMLQMPNGEDGYAKKVGNFAVMGSERAVVEAYTAGNGASMIAQQSGKLGEKYLGSGDAVCYVNLAKLGPVLQPKIKEAFDEMVAELNANVPPEQAGIATAVFSLYAEAIERLLADGQAGFQTIDISDTGIGLTYGIQTKPNTPMAKYFPGGAGQSMLSALPKQAYLIAASIDTKAIDLPAILEKALAKMPAEAGWIAKMYRDALPVAKMTTANGWAWYAPSAEQMMGPGLMNMISVYDTSDGPGYLAATKAYFEGINNLQMPAAPEMQPMTITSSYNAGTLNLEGQSIDQYTMSIALPQELMQQMGPMGGMMMMMGGLNYQGYLTAKGNKVIMSSSLDAAMMTEAIKAAGKSDGLGTDAGIVEARAAGLPPKPAMEAYVSVEGLLNTVNAFLPMMGGPQLPVKDGLPPLAAGIGIEDGGLAGRVYLPIKSLQGIMEAVMAAQAGFGGQAEPGNEGAAPPPPF